MTHVVNCSTTATPNIKFGNINYPDFILFCMDNQIAEGLKHRNNYLKRSSKIKGNWENNIYSPNSDNFKCTEVENNLCVQYTKINK